jgi:uncharacterized protein YkwD
MICFGTLLQRRRKENSMKKLTLLAVTALTLTGIGSQSLGVQAAPKTNWQSPRTGIYYTYSYGCNIQDILNRLESCLPGVSIPDCIFPGGNAPDAELPDCDLPNGNCPDVNIPETDTPGNDSNDNLPDTNLPGESKPEVGLTDNSIPEQKPGTDSSPEQKPGNGSTEESIPEDSTHAFIQRVVDLVNAERAKEGLNPLTANTKVQAAAQVRAKECEKSFSHTRPNGSPFASALREQGVTYKSAGENIAWGQRSPEEVVRAWMNSAGHRKNIMNPNFTTIGVGYYENARGTDYWCQLFTR